MIKRVISSLIGLPLLILVVALGDVTLKLAIFGLIVIAMFEVYRALSGSYKPVHLTGYIFAAVYMGFIDYVTDYRLLTIILILMTMVVLCCLVMLHRKVNIMDACVTLFGFYYVALLLSSVYLVREYSYGQYFVWLIFIAAWGCDTGAYFTGKFIGKNKLTSLSPRKTIEGAIGGTVFATLLAFAYGVALSSLFQVKDIKIITYCVIAGAFGSVFAQFGDLTASAIKRYNNIKDYGNIIPGHGGIMDRFDSVLFTSPAIYLTLLVLVK